MSSNGLWVVCVFAWVLAAGCAPPPAAEPAAPAEPPAAESAGAAEAPVTGQPTGTTDTAVTLDLPDLVTDEQGRMVVGEGQVGVPFYPGATVVEGGASRLDTLERKVINVTLETYDSPAKVAEFYKGELREAKVSQVPVRNADVQIIRGQNEDGAQIKVSATREGRKPTSIRIRADVLKEPAKAAPPAEGSKG